MDALGNDVMEKEEKLKMEVDPCEWLPEKDLNFHTEEELTRRERLKSVPYCCDKLIK